jgi:hypothetical protein
VTGPRRDEARDQERRLSRTRRHNVWKLSFANAATACVLVCFVLLLFSPAWKMTLVAAVFVGGGVGILKWLQHRDHLAFLATEQEYDAYLEEQRRKAAEPRRPKVPEASRADQLRTWLAKAPPADPADPADEADPADGSYQVLETDDVINAFGPAPDERGLWLGWAWSPFQPDYRRSITRLRPERSIGSVSRTSDGRIAIRWDPL